MVLKIAHRGASNYAPENTIEAFKKAIRLGVDVVEFDVHRTKDNKIIVMHDNKVEKTTNGVGLIKNLSFKEIRKFHEPNGELIPTLQEVLDILKNKCICKIDIKDNLMEEKIARIIKKNHLENSVIITSKIFSTLKKIKQNLPKIKIERGGFKEKIPVEKIIKKAKSVKADIIGPHYSIITKKLIEEAHKNGIEIHAWVTVDNKKTIEKMKKLGVDGITSDWPDKI